MDEDSRKESILIVDDTLPTIDLIRTMLEGQGYDVMVATTGEQAIKRAGLKTPDLILLDVLMPGMDGFEACRRLKAEERTRDVPVIFMTALGAMESKVKGFELGAVDYVTKPIEFEEVLARVRTHLSLRGIQKVLRNQKDQLQQGNAQRRRTEEALKTSEALFRTLVESSSDAILVLDPERKILSCNQAFLDLFGYGSSEVEGQSIRIIHPSEESFRTFGDKIYPVIRTVGACRTEWSFAHKNGTLIPVETVTSEMKSLGRSVKGYVAIIRDITQRRLTEDALKESEANYRMVIENANESIIVIQDGVVAFANRKALESTGYTADELISRPFVDFLHPEDRKMVYERHLQRLGGKGTPGPYGFRMVNKNGDCLWLEVNAVLTAWQGRPATLNFLTDITKRRQAEKALLESEAQKQAILDASIDGIRFVDKGMRIIWANKTTSSSLNVPSKELVGKTCHKAFHGRDAPCAECPTLRARQTGRVERAVLYQPGAGGMENGSYWDNYCVPLKSESGEITGFVQVTRNITAQRRTEEALRKSEAKYRALVEQIPAITYTAELDDASTTLYVSPQIETVIGFSQAEYSSDPDIWRKQLHPEDRDRVLMEVARSHETREPLRTEYRMLHRDGHVVWLRDEAVIVKDSTGRPLHLQGVMVDISGVKEAEERIHILSQELMKAHEEERRMISLELHDRVAQDLSTVKIGLYTLLCSRQGASSEIENRISELSGILQRSITAVRDMSYDLRPPSLDQLGLMQSVYQYCDAFSEQTGIIAEFTCAGMDGLRLDPDTEINLYRLVQEGLINVKRHAEATHVLIRLVASSPHIILRIIDDGKGFDADERRRAVANEKRMGLCSMEERARWLGGGMEIKSRPGKGTKIFVHIPHKEKTGGPEAEEDPVDRG